MVVDCFIGRRHRSQRSRKLKCSNCEKPSQQSPAPRSFFVAPALQLFPSRPLLLNTIPPRAIIHASSFMFSFSIHKQMYIAGLCAWGKFRSSPNSPIMMDSHLEASRYTLSKFRSSSLVDIYREVYHPQRLFGIYFFLGLFDVVIDILLYKTPLSALFC